MNYICDTGDEKIDAMLCAVLAHCCGSITVEGTLLVADAAILPQIHTTYNAVIALYDDDRYAYSPEHRSMASVFAGRYRAIRRPIDLTEFYTAALEIQSNPAGTNMSDAKGANCEILYENRTVTYRGRTAKLTAREDELFRLLYENCGKVVSRELIDAAVWGSSTSTNVTDVYISYLRRKLTPVFGDGVLSAVRGEGYILTIKK